MPVSLLQDSSLLAVNVGASSTRAVLFDVVDGQYRFIASGQARSTAEAPFKNISLGVNQAIAHLQTVTGKTLAENLADVSPLKFEEDQQNAQQHFQRAS